MFVVNFKMNTKKILIICALIALAVALAIEAGNLKTKDKKTFDLEISTDNFCNMLKETHTNMEEYLNKSVKISGFVFTMDDFKPQTFVCGRNMVLNGSDKVVGFMCELEPSNNFEYAENDWVEVEGIISQGYYQTKIPVIKITSIKNINPPDNTYVEPLN